MNPAIHEILQYAVDHPDISTKAAVDSYFDQFVFSLEKQEWDGLTDQEKQQFADHLDLQMERSQKGSGFGDNEPSR